MSSLLTSCIVFTYPMLRFELTGMEMTFVSNINLLTFELNPIGDKTTVLKI